MTSEQTRPLTAVDEERLVAHADAVQAELCELEGHWLNSKWTRRSFIAGVGMAGVATLGSQLVTSKAAYAAGTGNNGNTLITIFLRGAADGLRVLVPNAGSLGLDYLHQVRPGLVPANNLLLPIPGAGGWALNSAMAPLMPFFNTGELAFVPAVSTPGSSRSHFQAQQYLERGTDSAGDGWLDRTLAKLGPGTTFRAVSDGSSLPASLSGNQRKLSMESLSGFTFPGWDGASAKTQKALRTLYRGVPGPLGQDVPITLNALGGAANARTHAGVQNGASYPQGNFSNSMKDLATLLRAEVGMQVATVDVGGWDTHTDEANQLDKQLRSAAATLAAFLTDLGPVRRRRVTILVQTEFGRRVAMNASGGTDHGHGGVAWLLGGGISRAGVVGRWDGLSAGALDTGDVPGWNNAFDIAAELVQKRLGVGSVSNLFPGHSYRALGLAHA